LERHPPLIGIAAVLARWPKKEEAWHISKVVGLVVVPGKCIRQSVVNAKKNVKCLLSLEKIVRFIVKSVILSVKTKAVN
jgi:hypothetical protein